MAELIREKDTNTSTKVEEEVKVEETKREKIRKTPELSWFSRFLCNVVKTGKIPRSVAFIMDGNRRFATRKKQEKHMGHSHGLYKLEETLLWCKNLGITELTVFALAKENL